MTPALAVFAPVLVAYGLALLWCIERWNAESGSFAHCWLVPFVAAVVVWQRRRALAAMPRAVDRRGWWLLGPALLLHLAGALLMIDSWSAASLVLAVPGACWLALGAPRTRGLLPVLGLVVFAVPMPLYVEGRIAFSLKEWAVTAGPALGNAFGAGVTRVGDHLRLVGGDGALYVADACGGLRSLLATLTIAYCLACFFGRPGRLRTVVLLLAAPLLAVLANIVRIAVLCLFARHQGVPFAEGTGHTLANAAEWLVVCAALLSLARWLEPRSTATAVAETPVTAGARRHVGPRIAVLLWLAGPALLALSAWRPAGAASERAAALPEVVADYTLVPRSPAQQARFVAALPRWRELLGTGDFVWRSYRGQDGHWLNLVALFHDTNWKSVHPPRICIEGSDMAIEVDDLVPAPWLGGDAVMASRIVARRRSDGVRFVTLSVFGTADWASGDYWEFTRHHLPRALLRANLSGFLLRAESAVAAGEPDAAAEARCRAFLSALVPLSRELLR
jgi:exosortase